MKLFQFLLLSVVPLLLFCSGEKSSTNSTALKTEIDAYIQKVSERYQLPSTSVAIVKNGKVIYKKQSGMANIEHQVPISSESIYRVYSLTKPIVCVGLFQLIEQGKLSLDDKISTHLQDLPAAWSEVQIKHLITHSSGLPEISSFPETEGLTEEMSLERIINEPLSFQLGTTFEYNQTNYWILRRIIDQVVGEATMEEFIIGEQFGYDKTNSTAFFSSDSRTVIPNRTTPYFPFRTGERIIDHSYAGDFLHAANGLNLTLEEMINWDLKFRDGELISDATKSNMWEEFNYDIPVRRFAFGWEKRELNEHLSYGFSGSLVTAYRVFPEEDMSIIFFANGMGKYFAIDNIVNQLAYMVNEDIYDPYYTVYEALLQASSSPNQNAISVLESLRANPKYEEADFESTVNDVGYYLMRDGRLKEAIVLFESNVENYPDSWNVYDSLGEALENATEVKRALAMYKKALTLNVDNELDYNDTLRGRIRRLEKHDK